MGGGNFSFRAPSNNAMPRDSAHFRHSAAPMPADEAGLVALAVARDEVAIRTLMRRYNQRLYRTARSILHDDTEAEDVMQDAYVRAYQHLGQFAGHSSFATWLTRIAVNEALRRLPARKRLLLKEEIDSEEDLMDPVATSPNPEQNAALHELGRLLENAILELPERYRTVVVMRDIEEMSTA